MDRLLELKKLLEYHAEKYYTQDEPEISDAEYDELYDEYVKLEKELGVHLEDSPAKKVGGRVLPGFSKHTHLSPLFSLEKAKTLDELLVWQQRNVKLISKYEHTTGEKLPELEYSLEYKFDGLTINLTYQNGNLTNAATRGDGVTGEEILEQIKTIKEIPKKIDNTQTIEVQGEAIMRLSVLEEYNKTAQEPLKNARNAVAGALRNLDLSVTKKRNLNVFMYNIGYCENPPFNNHFDMIGFLKSNGFPVSEYVKKITDINDILELVSQASENRQKLDFLIDGMVIKISDFKTRDVLGYTEKFPRWAIAYKFEAEEMTTKLKNIEWNVGRTGKLTPTAVLERVDIGGVTVERATLNNYGDILRKKLKLPCNVFIRRSNDVIPEVLGVAKLFDESRDIEKPANCPSCGFELTQKGAHIFCENSLDCKPQLVARFNHFVSREAMNIEGFSVSTSETLIDRLGVSSVCDIYNIDYEKLEKLERFGAKKVENLKNAIEKSKKCSLSAFIFSLGIPNVGKKTAKDLTNTYNTLNDLIKAPVEELIKIRDIGLEIATSIKVFFENEHNLNIIDKMLELGVDPQNIKSSKEKIFSGKTFVVTGTLKKYSRSDIQDLITSLGGRAASSVSKNTDFVLIGENPGSKADKAIQLNVPVIDEESFENMLKKH